MIVDPDQATSIEEDEDPGDEESDTWRAKLRRWKRWFSPAKY